MGSSLEATKRLHSERRQAKRCIYDRRDRGGEAHGPVFRAGRCECCYVAAQLSYAKRTRERAIDQTLERVRASRDELYTAHLQKRLDRARRELDIILQRIKALPDPVTQPLNVTHLLNDLQSP